MNLVKTEFLMLNAILKIRLLQTFRLFKDLGIIRFLVLISIVVLLLIYIFGLINRPEFAYFVAISAVMMVFILDSKRTDKLFLKGLFEKSQLIFIAEYLIITLPISILLLIDKQFLSLIFLYLGLITVSISTIKIKIKETTLNNRLIKWIPSNAFEIIGGLRSHFYPLLLVNILGIAFSFWAFSAPIAITINTLIWSSFYQKCEPRNWIIASELPANRFLIDKIKKSILIFISFQLPLIASFVCFNHNYFLILLIILTLSILYLVLAILLKYALFESNRINSAHQIVMGIVLFTLPILLIMLPIYYLMSEHKLNKLLNDFN